MTDTFKNLFSENVHEAVYIVDKDWKFVAVNPLTLQFWNKKTEELIGKTVWAVFPQAKDSIQYKKLMEAFEKNEEAEFETISPVLQKWIAVQGYPHQDKYIIKFRIISRKNQLEDELRSQLNKKK